MKYARRSPSRPELITAIVWLGCILVANVTSAQLTSIAKIVALSDEQAAEELPVDVECTVRYVDSVWSFMFVQQGDDSIYVHDVDRTRFRFGQRVRIKGVTHRGDTKNVLMARDVTVLDSVVEMPPPLDVRSDDIASGSFDCDFVSTRVTVLQAFTTNLNTVFYCHGESDNARLFVTTCEPLTLTDCHNLVGRTVHVTGSVGLRFEARPFRRPADNVTKHAFQIFVPTLDYLEVEDPGPELMDEPTGCQLRDLVDEDTSYPRGSFLAHGQIVLCRPDYLLIAGGDGSVRLQMHTDSELISGQVVRLCGRMVRSGNTYEPFVTAIHPVMESPIAQANKIDARQAVVQQPIDQRISVEGSFVGFDADDPGRVFMKAIGSKFDIKFFVEKSQFDLLHLESADRVRVAGIFAPPSREESDFELLVTRIDDVKILGRRITSARLLTYLLFVAGALSACGIVWAVTLRRRVRERTFDLSEATSLLRASFNSVDDGILAVSNSGRTLAVNEVVSELVGVSVGVGDTIEGLVESVKGRIDDCQEFEQQCRHAEEDPSRSIDFDVQFVRPERRFISVRTAPIRRHDFTQPDWTTRYWSQHESDPSIVGRLWVFRDETEVRKLQSELLHSQKLEAVGRLAGGVAHDFNNLLTAVTANLSIAQQDPNAQVADVIDSLVNAEDAAFQSADIIRRLLSFSRRTELNFEVISINRVICDLLEMVRHSFDATVRFNVDLDPTAPTIWGDGAAISQVILNLLVNARDAMPDGGCIDVSTRGTALDKNAACDWVTLRVRDDGVGMPVEVQQRMFEPFFTTKGGDHGTGLGLSISYGIVSQHQGRLTCVSEPGVGTTFEISFPVCSVEEEELAPVVQEAKKPYPRRNVLVVDDEEPVREATRSVLNVSGFHAFGASDGMQAILALEQKMPDVDIVVLDATMPGMSGGETLSVIKDRWPALPVVVCSGYIVAEHPSSADAYLNADGFIQKPYERASMVDLLNKLIARIPDEHVTSKVSESG